MIFNFFSFPSVYLSRSVDCAEGSCTRHSKVPSGCFIFYHRQACRFFWADGAPAAWSKCSSKFSVRRHSSMIISIWAWFWGNFRLFQGVSLSSWCLFYGGHQGKAVLRELQRVRILAWTGKLWNSTVGYCLRCILVILRISWTVSFPTRTSLKRRRIQERHFRISGRSAPCVEQIRCAPRVLIQNGTPVSGERRPVAMEKTPREECWRSIPWT